MSIDFSDHDVVKAQLEKDQADEKDARDLARRDQHFLNDVDGMWEDDIIKKFGDRPRYTFDMISHQIDNTAGEIEQNEFQAKVDPMGAGASKDTAKVLNGVIRNIQVASNASRTYQRAGKKMIQIGFDAWRVITDFESETSFKQVLKVQKVDNAINRIWFDSNSVEEDRSDARWAWDLRALNTSVYDEMFPDGSGESLSEGDTLFNNNNINRSREVVVVAEILYKKEVSKEYIEFSDGSVLENDDKLQAKMAGMEQQGIRPVRKPTKKKSFEIKSRWFDGGDWLTDEQDTPFQLIPICPVYGNFDVVDNQISYSGMTRKLIDPQMVLNYAESRKIEEGAISPRPKYWMTRKQAAGHETELEQMNVSANPVQLYEPDEKAPPPSQQGTAPVNPSLSETSATMQNMIQTSTNQHTDPQRNIMSGVALERAENKGNTSNIKYHNSLVVGIQYTCQVLMSAIPVVHDTRDLDIRIVEEDGTADMVKVNTTETGKNGEIVPLNDLSIGSFDVTCSVGQAFQNRQQAAVEAQLRLGDIIPEVVTSGADVLIGNINAPGMGILQERARKQLFDAGVIPEEQWTDAEKERVQEEIEELQAEQDAGAGQTDPIQEAVVADAISQIEKRAADAENQANELLLKMEQQQAEFLIKQEELDLKREEQERKNFETMIKSIKDLREGFGMDTVIGPPTVPLLDNQARLALNSQNEVSNDLPTNSGDIPEPSGI